MEKKTKIIWPLQNTNLHHPSIFFVIFYWLRAPKIFIFIFVNLYKIKLKIKTIFAKNQTLGRCVISTFVGSFLDQYFICPRVFLGQVITKNLSLCSWEITKKSFCQKRLYIFHFPTLWIWLFGIFDKCPQAQKLSRSSTDWWPGPQKVQFQEITGYL